MGLTCSLFRFLAHPKTLATMKVPLECCSYSCASLFDNAQGRYMACSGGWDWAMYSSSTTPLGLPTLSFGFWKSV